MTLLEKNIAKIILTPKQFYVYIKLSEGEKQKEVAKRLNVSQVTVSKAYSVSCDKIRPIMKAINDYLDNLPRGEV